MTQHMFSWGAGCIDGETLIEMNNLSIGFVPMNGSTTAFHPNSTVPLEPMEGQVPVPAQDCSPRSGEASGTNS